MMTEEAKAERIEMTDEQIEAFAKHVMAFEVDNSDLLGAFRMICLLQGLAQWMADSLGLPLPKVGIEYCDEQEKPEGTLP
jgi:hypothetical protein